MVSFTGGKGWRVTIAAVFAMSLMFILPINQASAAGMTHQVTNAGDKSFTVTWVTDAAETGYVNYGTSAESLDNTAYDDRGETTEDDTHHVSITGLTANVPYYYEIASGSVTYNNDGAPYEITTGPGLTFTMPEMVSGKVYKTGGVTAAEGAIVYANIGTSQVLSVLVDSSGTWGLNIAPIRTANYQSYYTHSDSDDISLDVQGGADGTATQTVTIATAKAGAPDMVLAVLPGDADGDSAVDALDLAKVVRIILLLDAETPGADANLDGVVNVLDLTEIARIILTLD